METESNIKYEVLKHLGSWVHKMYFDGKKWNDKGFIFRFNKEILN